MTISREADYAMRILLFMGAAPQDERISAQEISDQMHIPERFNLKILRKLTMAGLTQSFRGIYGGYMLAQEPCDISLLQIIEAIDGPIHINHCLKDALNCSLQFADQCPVHRQMRRINNELRESLSTVTLDTLSDDMNERQVSV